MLSQKQSSGRQTPLGYNAQRPLWRIMACAVGGAVACSQGDDPPSDNANSPTHQPPDNCASAVGSYQPCPGLHPECVVSPRDPAFISWEAFTDCIGDIHETGTITEVSEALTYAMLTFNVRTESGCDVTINVAASSDMRPTWPWAVDGQTLDVELWSAGGPRRSGSPMLFILRNPGASDFLFAIHQSGWGLRQAGRVKERLGFDVDIQPATCESYAEPILVQHHLMRFQTDASMVDLDWEQPGALTLANEQTVRVQHAFSAFTSVYPPEIGVYDLDRGAQAYFSAWPVQ